ncbi:MAG: glycerophosphodiester phosphodiesterase [Nitrospirae bacterium]|nr:glycerophosphodiester phosphodiesterase [Nitrospirota bacterium]
MPIPLVIAHRGDSSNAVENSLDAIHRALSLPVDMIELDIRKSRDNGLFVMHDTLTGRTAGNDVNIERATSDAIGRIRLNNGEPVPTLTDVIKAVAGSAGLNFEIKSDGAGLLTAEYFASSAYNGYVLLSSFKEEEILAVRRALPSMPTSLIFDVFTEREAPSYREQGYRIISLKKKTVSKKLVDTCHEQGIDVYVWTVDDEVEMRQFIAWGVDGIYSNKPRVLKKLLERSELRARS